MKQDKQTTVVEAAEKQTAKPLLEELRCIDYSNGRQNKDRLLAQICALACKEAKNLEVLNPYTAAVLFTIADLAEMTATNITEDRNDIEKAVGDIIQMIQTATEKTAIEKTI